MRRVVIAVVLALVAVLAGNYPAGASTEGYAWSHTVDRWPVVYVENHTDGRWSVTDSVRAWGSGLRIGSCRLGAGCIRITSPARGGAAPLGQTFISVAGRRIVSAAIELNASDEAQPASVRRVAGEHELGHALGLGHDTSRHSVMGPVAYGYDYINSHVRTELAGVYGV